MLPHAEKPNENMLQGQENLGMAMTFTLVSHLREQLVVLVKAKLDRQLQDEKEKERRAIEVGFNEPHGSIIYLMTSVYYI